MRKNILLLLLFCLQCSAVLKVFANSQVGKLPVWTPSKSLINRLVTPKQFGSVQVRPPRGYMLQQKRAANTEAYAWVGAAYEDGTRPYIMLLKATPPSEEHKYSLELILDKFLQGIKQRRKDWQRSNPERGLVNGLVFTRTRWSGIDLVTQRRMHGFMYVAKSGRKIIQISSQQTEPYHKEALQIAEASTLTFRRK